MRDHLSNEPDAEEGVFSLLDEKWIPVLYADGRRGRVRIRQALTEAGDIRQIAASNPMDNVALLRFLLAVLYWCKGAPPTQGEKDRILAAGQFPAGWFAKLDGQEDCFNLLGDGKRFYQNTEYRQRTAEHTTNYLIHEVPSGTNKWHFRHALDRADGLCPACCAMGLIRLPVFATSAGKGMSPSTGKSPGINSKPPLYVIPVGKSLAATLLLSWQTTGLSLGTPEWETPGNTLPASGEVPLLTGLTWLPRNVWLAQPEEHESICACCGRKERLIRVCVFDGKGSTKAGQRIWRDPHVIYEAPQDGKASTLQTSNALGATDAAAGQWAKRTGAILRNRHSSGEGTLWIVGFSTVQNDKYLEATECLLPLPCSSEQDNELIAMFERWQKEGASLARRIRPKEEPSSRKHAELRPAVDAIRPQVETRVSQTAGQLFGGDQAAWDHAALEYGPLMQAIATSLAPGFTTRVLERRNQIAQALPDMTPKPTQKSRKPVAKKGGEK